MGDFCDHFSNKRFFDSLVGAPSEAWRFLQGESPCRTRLNQPIAPSVVVMKEQLKPVREVTVGRENLGVEAGMTATSTSLLRQGHKTLTSASEQHH